MRGIGAIPGGGIILGPWAVLFGSLLDHITFPRGWREDPSPVIVLLIWHCERQAT